jgi:hypothetical protein
MKLPISTGAKPHIIDEEIQLYAPSNSHHFFPHSLYIQKRYNTVASNIQFETPVSMDIVSFLEKKGELIYEGTCIPREGPTSTSVYSTMDVYDESEMSQSKTFFYKDIIICLERTHSRKIKLEKSNFKMTLYYSSSNPLPIKDLEKFFIKEDIKNVIFTIMRDEHGSIKFEPFEVAVPESFDIDKCYNDDFGKVHQAIVGSLNKNESGLYLFHGDPGTGKTTYIKHLSSLVDRDIIYVPTAFVESLSDPSFLPALLHKKHSILVIEDAEKALLARDPSDSSSVVSAILNITDGIMANVFNIAIIATYNSSRQCIDKALLRKGRLKAEYQFGKLSVSKTQKIMDELGTKKEVKEPMILADIYNNEEDSIVVSSELFEEKRMGFR